MRDTNRRGCGTVHRLDIRDIVHEESVHHEEVDRGKPPSVRLLWTCSSFDSASQWTCTCRGSCVSSIPEAPSLGSQFPCRNLHHGHPCFRPCRFWMVAFPVREPLRATFLSVTLSGGWTFLRSYRPVMSISAYLFSKREFLFKYFCFPQKRLNNTYGLMSLWC